MKLDDIIEENFSRQEKRKAIQLGNVSKDIAFAIGNDLAKIIKKHINDKDWKYDKHFLDQGIRYKGEDTKAANKTIDAIIGDIYGYFVDVPKKEVTRVKKGTRIVGGENQEVYTIKPQDAKTQIEFFKFLEKPALGIMINI
jgi:hypothetical protein